MSSPHWALTVSWWPRRSTVSSAAARWAARSSTCSSAPSTGPRPRRGPRRAARRACPRPATRPPVRITARSQARSTSSRRWEDSTTLAPGALVQAGDQLQHGVALDRIEPVGRLVEEDQVGGVGDGLSQLDPLALAGGHRAQRPEPLLAEPDQEQGVGRTFGGVVGGQTVHLGHVPDEVVGGLLGWHQVVLGRVADPHPDVGSGRPGAHPQHLDGAGVGLVQAQHEADQRGLARAVGAEQPGGAGVDLDVGRVQHRRGAVPLDQPGRPGDGTVIAGTGWCCRGESVGADWLNGRSRSWRTRERRRS